MQKLNLTKNKLNKKCYEVLKNIEILSFISKSKIENYIKFIISELEKKDDMKKLIPYIKKNWFKKNYEFFNYSELLEKSIGGDDKYLDKFYITNNISESLHAKLNFYLPKNVTNSEMFSLSLTKVLIDDTIKKDCIKRYDFKTRALIKIIEKFNLNENPKWINYKVFNTYEKELIINSSHNQSDYEINEIYKNINFDIDNEILELSQNKEEKLNSTSSNQDNSIKKNQEILNNIVNQEINYNVDNEGNIINKNNKNENFFYQSPEEVEDLDEE